MSTWADNLRIAIAELDTHTDLGMLLLVELGERQLAHAMNTIECLVEANAALREQLCCLKAERGQQKLVGADAAPVTEAAAEFKMKARAKVEK